MSSTGRDEGSMGQTRVPYTWDRFETVAQFGVESKQPSILIRRLSSVDLKEQHVFAIESQLARLQI
jgi:hypothetical protein